MPLATGEVTMNNDIIAGKWKQLTGKATAAWGELTDDELTRTEGNAERLAGLIQERYGKTKEQAEKEVRDFFDRNP
jgi:uncharacterized protein YjbJ (UPF0337 family)